MAHQYVVTAHPSTAVSHALTGHFTHIARGEATSSNENVVAQDPQPLNLVLCKGSLIEVYSVTPHGLEKVLDIPIHARVATISKHCRWWRNARHPAQLHSTYRDAAAVTAQAGRLH